MVCPAIAWQDDLNILQKWHNVNWLDHLTMNHGNPYDAEWIHYSHDFPLRCLCPKKSSSDPSVSIFLNCNTTWKALDILQWVSNLSNHLLHMWDCCFTIKNTHNRNQCMTNENSNAVFESIKCKQCEYAWFYKQQAYGHLACSCRSYQESVSCKLLKGENWGIN